MEIKTFVIKLNHDNGFISIKTYASNKDSAIRNILNFESAPFSAIVDVKELATTK